MIPDDLAFPAPGTVAAYLLAGGASERMGRSKAHLELDGEALAVVLARRFAPYVACVTLVVKDGPGDHADLGLPLVFDATPERALVHGIRTALEAPGPEWRLLLACDMPDVGPGVLGSLWRAARDAGAPGSYPERREDSAPEPLPSLWHRDALARRKRSWGKTARTWIQRAGLARWCPSDEEAMLLRNLNTPDAWTEYLAARSVEPFS